VCYSDLTHPAKAPCGHNEICGTCHLRLRYLHTDRACPMCKHVNEQLIVDDDSFYDSKQFKDYPMWGNELGANFVYKEDVGMFFPREHYEQDILPLFGYACTSCKEYDGTAPDDDVVVPTAMNPKQQQQQQKKKKVTPLSALQDHLRNKHRQTLCEICIEFKRDFVAKLPRFSPTQLKTHCQTGDGISSGFSGHPLCEFCRPKRFYDLTQLHLHLRKDHYKCHVCEKQGLDNQFFRNYTTLEQHFEKRHFLCKDPQCLAARFMVYENELDLRHHSMSTHGVSGGSTKINLEFRVRREGYDGSGYDHQSLPTDQDFGFGVDGQAFVPQSLPQPREPSAESSHPQHLLRTAELRAQAQEIRQQLEAEVESFPTLAQSTMQTDGQFRMGWTSNGITSRVARMPGIQANTQEQYPSLPSIKKSHATKIKSGAVSGSRKLNASATITSANWNQASVTISNQPLSVPSHKPTAALASSMASNSRSNLASDNFPSLEAPSSSAPKPYKAAQQLAAKKHAPAMNTSNFPPPPTSNVNTSARQKVLGGTKVAPPAMNHMNFPPPLPTKSMSNGAGTVDKLKAKLGPTRYKELKNLTKEFAVDAIAPDAYVDHAASLFENGYGDNDFWTFVPTLLMSCPNEANANRALRYMDQLRTSNQSTIVKVSESSWGSVPPATVKTATRTAEFVSSAANWHAPPSAASKVHYGGVTVPSVARSKLYPSLSGSKKPSAWASGASSTTLLVASAKGSVAVAAANQGASVGTATKAMAKEQKQIKQAAQLQQEGSKDGKKKKKKANELRDLAFGR